MLHTSYSKTLSIANPYVADSLENPPPRVNPPRPTSATLPPTVLRLYLSRPSYKLYNTWPLPSFALDRSEETSIDLILCISIVTPPTEIESSASRAWPPPLTAKRHDVSRMTRRILDTSSVVVGRTRQADWDSCCFASQTVRFTLPGKNANEPESPAKREH